MRQWAEGRFLSAARRRGAITHSLSFFFLAHLMVWCTCSPTENKKKESGKKLSRVITTSKVRLCTLDDIEKRSRDIDRHKALKTERETKNARISWTEHVEWAFFSLSLHLFVFVLTHTRISEWPFTLIEPFFPLPFSPGGYTPFSSHPEFSWEDVGMSAGAHPLSTATWFRKNNQERKTRSTKLKKEEH